VTRKQAVRSAVREFSERVLDGVLSPFVAYFAEERNLSAKDRAQLRAILERGDKPKGK
jgi:predicted transcriptional regulator